MTMPSVSSCASSAFTRAHNVAHSAGRHVLAVDARHLLGVNPRDLRQRRHGVEQFIDADYARFIARGFRGVAGLARDGSARGQHGNARQ